jgi:hypothetical protein
MKPENPLRVHNGPCPKRLIQSLNKLRLLGLTQASCNLNCSIYMCATCVGLYLGHSQACQCKNITQEDKIQGDPCLHSFFI